MKGVRFDQSILYADMKFSIKIIKKDIEFKIFFGAGEMISS